ncbi:CPuORF35 - conserved peptide uORF-containing transcript [Musa troglodytarum]|uniref:CPuORF35 - conserved peptide uORF-containing transcript n=2 Tax=Musa troglodytarum TaxID=320322 RepID=A0A9E7KUU6_9LILI|nr:CPuORF35 - conserved peptide uORF-containing transcript [Musa troglodytarum]
MVCQAATRTTFRALKHENGIAGSTTIIVRVLACFQPLQDCQAEYFRHLLKPVINLNFVLMGKDIAPQFDSQHPSWRFIHMNSASNIQRFDIRPQNNNSMLLPACVNPYGCVFSVNSAKQFPGICTDKSLQKMPSLIPPLTPSQRPPEFDALEKRYLAFDQLRDGRSYIYSSSSIPYPFFNSVDLGFGLQGSTDTNVSNGHGAGEMHEDTEEINALLYSDSDEDHDDEEASTGHSPVGATGRSLSEVASSMLPAKRRRVDVDEFDASLVDTASSQVLHCPDVPTDHGNKGDGKPSESSCVKGGDHPQNVDDVHIKRARIQETVSILRRIIPGGNGKDAATVLDVAITYLKSLKLKAKSLNASP